MIKIETNFKDYFVMTNQYEEVVEFTYGCFYSQMDGDEEPLKSELELTFEQAWLRAKLLLGVD